MAGLNLTPQQLRAIKNSSKGMLPKFLGGVYNDKNVSSIGGSMRTKVGQIGGTIGIDKKTKKPFGSYNINSKIRAKFGPQE